MTPREAIQQLQVLLSDRKSYVWAPPDQLKLTVGQQGLQYDLLLGLRDFGFEFKLSSESEQRAFDAGQEGTLAAGERVEITVPREWGKMVVARDFDDLLSFPNAHDSLPTAYFVCRLNLGEGPASWVAGEDSSGMPALQFRYHQAIELWETLCSITDHVNAEGHLMFFGTRPIEIRPGFDRAQIENKPLWVPGIKSFIENVDRSEVRHQIFRACLGDLLRDTDSDHAFRTLLQSTDIFERHLREGMAIYLADNTPEKLAAEGRASAMALSESLEKIIGGLEAKGLSIPAALLLAVKDIQPGAHLGGLNGVISASLLTFAITMFLIHRSQSALINQLISTIDFGCQDLKRKGLDEKNPVISERFKTLRDRAGNAKWGSLAVVAGSLIPLAVVVWMSIWGTPRPPVVTPCAASATHSQNR